MSTNRIIWRIRKLIRIKNEQNPVKSCDFERFHDFADFRTRLRIWVIKVANFWILRVNSRFWQPDCDGMLASKFSASGLCWIYDLLNMKNDALSIRWVLSLPGYVHAGLLYEFDYFLIQPLQTYFAEFCKFFS